MRLGTGAKSDATWPADKKIGRAKVGAGNAEAVISGPETIRTMTTPKRKTPTGVANDPNLSEKVQLGPETNGNQFVCLKWGFETSTPQVRVRNLFAPRERSKPASLPQVRVQNQFVCFK